MGHCHFYLFSNNGKSKYNILFRTSVKIIEKLEKEKKLKRNKLLSGWMCQSDSCCLLYSYFGLYLLEPFNIARVISVEKLAFLRYPGQPKAFNKTLSLSVKDLLLSLSIWRSLRILYPRFLVASNTFATADKHSTITRAIHSKFIGMLMLYSI